MMLKTGTPPAKTGPTEPNAVMAGPPFRRDPLIWRYFRSGWAFFIPYLATYLLYAWLDWPVNPAGATGPHLSFPNAQPGTLFGPPCLLHMYWILHGGHLLLGSFALVVWWQAPVGNAPPAISGGVNLGPQDLKILARLWPIAPWVLLGLVFFVPGVYLEFPGDVWEHYLRINDWSMCPDVGSYTGWHKSAYFIAYSLVVGLPAVRQLFWLDFYYTVMCLLVCWQYYLLMREARLSHRAALIFVLFQALLLGNSLFSFYRYYGLASTAPAQLAALASIRIGLSWLTELGTGRLCGRLSGSILQALACLALLMTLMAFNHPQALGLALLGLMAVVVWQVGEWKRAALLWLAAGVVLASFAIVCYWPIDPVVRDVYRSTGWMTPWYGFNLVFPHSPAAQRSIQLLGAVGLLNLAAGAWLLRRNHLAGWLTLTPVLALLCPLFAIPFATLLSKTSIEYVVVAPRMLLGIPTGMTLVVVCQEALARLESSLLSDSRKRTFICYAAVVACMAAFLIIPANAPYYNRCWQALARTPADLTLQGAIADFSRPELARFRLPDAPHFLTTNGLGFAARAAGFQTVTFSDRVISYPDIRPPSAEAEPRFSFLANPRSRDTAVYAPSVLALHSAHSLAGFLSGHWWAQEVALGHAASPETAAFALRQGTGQMAVTGGTLYFISR